MSLFRTLLLSLALLPSGQAASDSGTLVLDDDGCRVSFRLKATLHSVKGSFAAVGGRIDIQAEGRLQGTIRLDAGTAQTGNGRRDRKMHEQVLLSERFPLIELQLQSWSGELSESGGRVAVRGTLVLQEREHAVETEVDVKRQGDRFSGRAELEIPYVEWGLEDPSAGPLRVGKVVRVRVDLAGRLEADEQSRDR